MPIKRKQCKYLYSILFNIEGKGIHNMFMNMVPKVKLLKIFCHLINLNTVGTMVHRTL